MIMWKQGQWVAWAIGVVTFLGGQAVGAEERSPLAPLKKGGTEQFKVPLIKGDLGGSKGEGKKQIPRVRDLNRPATTLKDWLAQVEAAIVQITGVKLERTDTGLEISLETAEGKPLQVDATKFKTEGNSLIADIPNAVLALPEGQAFNTDNPTTDIANIRVTQLNINTIRVGVTGNNSLPRTEVTLKTGEFAYSLNPEAEEPDEEIVVTGEGQERYRVPNASTATRTDTPIRDVPASIQVVPRQVLEDQKVQTVRDALRNVSGVTSQGNYGGTGAGSTNIRGFAQDINFKDGFRNNDFYSISETANVEQIEVLKEPASVLYGQAQPGGIVNIVTKKPLPES
ncbi:MAG: TonB-dependent receptor plug domain-containing protein [Leptolyngbyaceae cyanobacterium RU_5_1]|nr:TonB-dependent receptor plug domain-containing protein [Leptolyngbyaceae cyanobacterium RU_5_1]